MKVRKVKEVFFSVIITGFIRLAFEGISSFLYHKRHKAIYKAVKAMAISTDMQRNKLMHLENTLVMYGIYNAETLENLVKIQYMLYTVGRHYMKVYLQARHQQPVKHIHKCTVHVVFSIMQLI